MDTTDDIWSYYILPHLHAVDLWLLAGTCTVMRARVQDHVDRDIWQRGWFKAGFKWSRTRYMARHAPLFWRLFEYFGVRAPLPAKDSRDSDDDDGLPDLVDLRVDAPSWEVAFMASPSAATLEVLGSHVVLATYTHHQSQTIDSLLRWCQAPHVPDSAVLGVLVWMRDHECLPRLQAVVDRALIGYLDVCRDVFVRKVGHDKHRCDKVVLGLLALGSGRIALVRAFQDGYACDAFADDFRSVNLYDARLLLRFALLSGSMDAVDFVMRDVYPKRRVRPYMGAPEWSIALCQTASFCVHLLTSGYSAVVKKAELAACRLYSVTAAANAATLCADGQPQQWALARLLTEPLSNDNHFIVEWTRRERIFSDADMQTIVMPRIAHALAPRHISETVGERAAEMKRCLCRGHALARLFHDAGFSQVFFAEGTLENIITLPFPQDEFVIVRGIVERPGHV